MASFAVLISRGPFHGGEAEWPLRFVNQALANGHSVKVFLIEDGVWLAKKGQQYETHPDLEEHIKNAIKNGAEIRVCATCARRRSLTEKDYLPGLIAGTMLETVEATASADKILTF